MKHPNSAPGFPAQIDARVATIARAPGQRGEGRETLSLDGDWQLAFDPENRGKRDGWTKAFPRDAATAPVPAVWELVRPGYDGVGWYRRVFTLPAGWEKRSLRLRFGAAQYFAEVWLNGVRLGEHEGGFLPFEFAVSKHARVGENEVVVRVINPPMNHEIEGFRCGAPLNQGPIPVGKAGWYYNFGGLWQSVELLATDGAVLSRVVPEPSLEPEQVVVKLDVEIDGSAAEHEIVCEIRGANGEAIAPSKTTRRKLKAGANRVSVTVALPGARRWSTEDPFLNVARVTVRRAGCVADVREVRFGMRSFAENKGRFELNGRPIVLKGFLQQGSYPRTLVRPENRAFAELELRAVKDRGFNFVRAHMLPPIPEWLDLCDELGLLVMAEPPIGWIERTEHAEQRCWREIKGLIERDAHHASIVMWCLMNEVFHLRGFTPKVVIDMTARWLTDARRMDPTRPIVDVSGGHGFLPTGGAEDMLPDTAKKGLTAMWAPAGDGALRPILDAHIYHEFPQRDATIKRLRTQGDGDRLFFLTEYGAPPVPPMFDEVIVAYTPAERELGLEDYQLHADFAASLRERFKHPAVRAACRDERTFLAECNRLRAEEMHLTTVAFRSNPAVAGYCFCQLADASGELFGALDVWRRPKPVMEALAKASEPGALGVFATPRVAPPGTKITVELAQLGELVAARGVKGEWSLALTDETGRVRKRWSGAFRPDKNGKPGTLLETTFEAPSRAGAWRLVASGKVGEVALHGGLELCVVPARSRSRGTVAVNGVGSELAQALRSLGLEVVPFGNNYREAELPIFLDLSRPPGSRQHWFEELGQLRKILQLGGCAVVFEPEMALVREVLPEAAIGMQPMMRPVGYTVPSPLFGGQPSGGLMDFAWAELGASRHDRADDVHAAGGEVLAGALSFNMWTRPAEYQHGASLYTLPVGKGTLIVCHHRAPAAHAAGYPAAGLLLDGLVAGAKARIRVKDTTPLLSRCIDPLVAAVE